MRFPKSQNHKLLFLIFLSLILISPSISLSKNLSPWTGKVVGISDGDTITVMKEGRGVKVRLSEIDCPESGQSFGAKAKRLTSDLCFGKEVTVKPTDIDRYSRVVAHVILQDGTNLNEEIIKAGLAWQYKQYSTSSKLAKLEAAARVDKIGIWSDPNPIPPWEWRHGQANQKKGIVSNPSAATTQVSAVYHGNVKSKVFHTSNCRYFSCKNCVATFNNRDESINAGYRPCKICTP